MLEFSRIFGAMGERLRWAFSIGLGVIVLFLVMLFAIIAHKLSGWLWDASIASGTSEYGWAASLAIAVILAGLATWAAAAHGEALARVMRAGLTGCFMVLLVLLLANAVSRLITGLWAASLNSPLGRIGFVGSVIAAVVLGTLTSWLMLGQRTTKAADTRTKDYVDGLLIKIKNDASGAPSPEILRLEENEAIQREVDDISLYVESVIDRGAVQDYDKALRRIQGFTLKYPNETEHLTRLKNDENRLRPRRE